MKKLQKLGVLAVLAIALFSLQNCSTSDEVLEQESVDGSSQTVSGRFSDDQAESDATFYRYTIRFSPFASEVCKQTMRDRYVNTSGERILASFLFNTEIWELNISEAVPCDGCDSPCDITSAINPYEILSIEPVD